ncbi:hypothetical protein C8R45DRAFT_1115521 [Mycena sanguinolenta]|nr:hypothetical protein C8R45DRAFT_1115521 [Mycena sanguinolenta]
MHGLRSARPHRPLRRPPTSLLKPELAASGGEAAAVNEYDGGVALASYKYGERQRERVHTRHDRLESQARRVGVTSPFAAFQFFSLFCLSSFLTAAILGHSWTAFSLSPPPCSMRLSLCSEVLLLLLVFTSRPTAVTAHLPHRPHLNVAGVDVRDPPLLACRLTSPTSSRCLAHPVDQQMALLALDHAYANDGPGELYVQGRRNLNGQLEFKVGETSSMPRRYGEYSKCTKNGHTLEWGFHCQVPHRKLAERLIHLSFRALGGVLVRYPCPGCNMRHREFYSLDNIGDLDAVVRVMSFWIVAIGGTFDQVYF